MAFQDVKIGDLFQKMAVDLKDVVGSHFTPMPDSGMGLVSGIPEIEP